MKTRIILVLLGLALSLTGCASKREKNEISRKVQSSSVTDPVALGASIQQAIQSSEHLSPEQKTKLEEIIAANKEEVMKLSQESYKFRSVLIEELLQETIVQKRINIIKKDIETIEKKKLKSTFDTIQKISEVVHHNPDKNAFAEPLKNFERSFR